MRLNAVFKQPVIAFLLIFFISISFAHPHSTANVWDVLRKQFTINHEYNQPEVRNQIQWLITHPNYIQRLAQAEPYIYHIVSEIKKRNLPGELALIPMIESAYNPFAYSGAGAAGLWQLMPGTGSDFGLKQDWWIDGRRSIRPSTEAALKYLSYLHRFFNGDWLLAFAAYDSGEGTILRIIKNTTHNRSDVSFWSLPVSQETRLYIPRLLALAEVIQYPQRYRIKLPDIPHIPYFEEVNVGSQIDLNHAAKLAGISYQDLIKLNPGYNRWATAPYRPYRLLVPANVAENFSRNLANVPEEERVSLVRHQVSAGDSLTLIAQKYHTTVNLIKELNQLKTTSVKSGQYVLIPTSRKGIRVASAKVAAKKADAAHFTDIKRYKMIHITQAEDTLALVADKYQVSIKDIVAWNHLNTETALSQGQQLIIWKDNQARGVYVIKQGDNLNRIAKTLGIKTAVLTRLNPNLHEKRLRIGETIRIG